jgi:para-aminobenzoate synthetase component 1
MNIPFAYFPKDKLLFVGSSDSLISRNDSLAEFEKFLATHQGKYVFTALSYDLKNEIEGLNSFKEDVFDFPLILTFVPEQVFELSKEENIILYGDSNLSFESIQIIDKIRFYSKSNFPTISFTPLIYKMDYIESVRQIKEEIQYGNCYELNFCQQYISSQVFEFDSFGVFLELYNQTKSPFSVYFNFEQWEVMCLSPERYIQRVGNRLISQPIKGTIRRGIDENEDKILQEQLLNDIKERSENVMIVDLVRNDLSKIATKGSVKVDELFGVYQFETLHHMISTVSCEMKSEISFVDCLTATFPMGSMTGAPKKMVMELIDKYESFKRGLYSGSIGYILPSGDFDFNVVIRSLFYNNINKILNCSVGSAITMKADAEKEYDECEVKVGNLLRNFKS